MPGGGGSSSSTEPPDYLKPYLQRGAEGALSGYYQQRDTPPLPGFDVLGGFSPQELQAQQGMLQATGQGQPLVDRTLGAATQMVDPYSDPAARTALAGLNRGRAELNPIYAQGGGQFDFRRVDPGWDIKNMMRGGLDTSLWDPALDEVGRRGAETFTNTMMPALRSEFGGAGQYGSERHAAFAGDAATKAMREISGAQAGMLTQAALDTSLNKRSGVEAALGLGRLEEGSLARRAGNVLQGAGMEMQGGQLYGDILRTGMQSQLAAPGVLDMTQWAPGVEGNIGALNRQRGEALRNQDLQRYLTERGYRLEDVQQYMAAIGGSGVNLGSITTTDSSGNPIAGGIGGAAAGAGLASGLTAAIPAAGPYAPLIIGGLALAGAMSS